MESPLVAQKSQKLLQILAAISASLGGFVLGTAITWTAPAFLRLDEGQCLPDDCDITGISEEEASWIASIYNLAAAAAGPISGFLMSRYGRKFVIMWYAIPMVVGYGAYIVADLINDNILIHVGRVLTGFASGSYALTSAVYIAEVSEPSLRGRLNNLVNFQTTVGQGVVNGLSINGTISWQIITWLLIIAPVVLFLTMTFMPETPKFHVSKGDNKKAAASLQRLRGKHYNVADELERIQLEYEREKAAGTITFRELLTKPLYYKPFITMQFMFFFQQFGAINVVMFYVQEIFNDAGTDLDPGLSAFIVSIAKLCGSTISIMLVDKLGRRFLLITSEILVCMSLVPLGTYFYMQEHSCLAEEYENKECINSDMSFSRDTVESLGWLPLVSLMGYVIAYALGLGPLPASINAEIYPSEAVSLACTIGYSMLWICSFAVTKLRPEMERWFGVGGTYYFYAGICAAGAVFVLTFLPETKNKTPEEIRNLFGEDPPEASKQGIGEKDDASDKASNKS